MEYYGYVLSIVDGFEYVYDRMNRAKKKLIVLGIGDGRSAPAVKLNSQLLLPSLVTRPS